MLKPLDSNQKFHYLRMIVAKDKAFIMAVDEQNKQTLYVLYHDLSTVKLKKLWCSHNIVKMTIKHGNETQKEQDEEIGIYLIDTEDDCTFVSFS